MPELSLLSGALSIGGRLDRRFFDLLRALEATGSLRRASATAGYSYKGAWLALETASNLAMSPLFESATGGSAGGGTRLTEAGRTLLAAWDELSARHRSFLAEQDDWLARQPAVAGLIRRMSMKSTARNQFAGTLTEVDIGPVSAQATVTVAGGHEITAAMTSASAKRLKLKKGGEAIALVKASAIVLVSDFAGYRLSARNQLAGTVSRIEKGPVSSLVSVTLPGGAVVTASVTQESVAAIGLAVGQPVTAVFKAYAVMLAVPAA